MVEAVVSFVAERIAGLLIEEVSFLKGVRAEFQYFQKELVSIQGFLETFDSIHNQDRGFRIWVADVRDIAYDIDDITDIFLLQEEGINNFFKRCARKFRNIFKLHKAGKDLKEIFSKLEDIAQRQRKYDTTNVHDRTTSSNTNEILLRRSYPHQRDDDIIGLEVQTRSLVVELLKEEERLRVVSIYGMGGLGKTTLAKEVYNHRNVKNHFDCYAWTSISQQMNTKAVLQEILTKVSNTSSLELGSMQEVELVEKIYAILEGKRYLVVIDDIWSTKDWDVLKPAFPNGKGSKIMFTTRNKEVAEHADRWSCHCEPRCLTNKEAWELLCKKAFPPNVMDFSLSSDKEKCGRDMVKKCGGLPLAIVVLGGLLASKRSLNEWETVHKQIGMVGIESGKEDVVLSILLISYLELPYKLKPLFLYLGLFPEDFNIPVKKLIHMWMAERLITKEEGETIEEVGRRYLEELINRCMVQIGKISLVTGRAKSCRVHDKMRDLCIDIGKKENFFDLVSHQNNDSGSSSSCCSKLRRCTIYVEEKEKGNQYIFPNHLTPCLRTVFFIPNGSFNYCSNMVYKDFKLLKVLVFHGDLKIGKEVSRVLDTLCNLRYLDFGSTDYCMDNELPQLRHLYGRFKSLPKISKMMELQSLCYVWAGSWMQYLVKLTNLEKLVIWRLNKETVGMFTIVINRLDKLRSLFLDFNFGCNFPSELLEALFENHHLLKLRLDGRINNGKFPSHVTSNLIKLTLNDSNLSEDPMPTLEKLQHLLYLFLGDSYSGKQMVCSAKGFPQLCFLGMVGYYYLEELTIEEGAMPCLKTCWIILCKKLKMVPQGLKFLTMIQELTIRRMPKSFEERVKEGGEDWETIKHVPSIIVMKDNY